MAPPRSSPKRFDGAIDRGAALRALDADDLRSFIGATLDHLEPEVRGPIEDALLRHAATRGGYRPTAPPPGIVDEAVTFAAAARRVGQAAGFEVDDYLRLAVTASLAGQHSTARRIFDAMLPPIAEGEIDLGQHEMVEEALSIDLHDCVSRYLLSTFLETRAEERAGVIFAVTERVRGLGVLVEPVRAMEQALGHELPQREEFLGRWIQRLESSPERGGDSESEHDRWLREAVERREGTAGLARLARETKRAYAAAAWCNAVVKEGDWREALDAYDESLRLVVSDFWRGEFLDGAALAALRLARKDATRRLEAAWLGAPSLARLLRWLMADDANGALNACPTQSSRQVAFLHVLTGNLPAAAKALESAPGLGWSHADHPGHLLFPVFAWMLGDREPRGVRAAVMEVLAPAPQSILDSDIDARPDDVGDAAEQPPSKLATPTVLELFERMDARSQVSQADRARALDAMRSAAAKRADGVTGEKRRRHYDHAATLVACCVEGDRSGSGAWLQALAARTSRFPAFQAALRAALGGARAQALVGSIAHDE